MTAIGIRGVSLYLPPQRRTNDWWPERVVQSWSARPPASPPSVPLTPGARRCVEAMAEQARDPFQGVVERRVMPDDMSLLDMEEAAAAEALRRAGIDRSQVDVLITNRTVPDFLLSNPACGLHERLGLRRECFSTHLDVATHSFLMQLTLVEAMLAAGRGSHALIVQSCAPSRIVSPESWIAPFFGDAATAVVVGPVTDGRGVLANVNFTDGRYPKTMIATTSPDRHFYDAGEVRLQVGDPAQLQAVFLQTADVCRESIATALARASRTSADVRFLSIHQGTPWLRRVVQEEAGLEHATSVETYRETGYLFASMIPASLAIAEDSGALHEDDLVVAVGGGPGQTYGASVMVWGA